MGKSMNGPDWTDVALTMSALQQVHECRVELTVTTAGVGGSGGYVLRAIARFDTLPGSDAPKEVYGVATWPNAHLAEMPATAYRLLLELDHNIGRAYRQRNMVAP